MARSLEVVTQHAVSERGGAVVQWAKSHKLIVVLVTISFLLRIYGLALYPFNGDEYNTIAEAKNIGLNWQSMLYYIFMHAWVNLGVNETLLRLPSAMLDIATVLVSYRLAKQLAGEWAAIAMGMLAATSPFLINHAQEARFYSLFIFTSTLFISLIVRLAERRPALWGNVAAAFAAVALMFSHFLGLVAIATQVLALFTALDLRWSRRKRAIVAVILLISAFVIPILPPVQRGLWAFYQSFAHTTSVSDPVTTTVSVINLVKIAITLYVFSFGYHVYPLWWFIVVPGVGLTGFLLVVGLVRLVRHSAWGLLPILFGLSLIGAYVVLDPIGGRLASGISARHVAFVWPVYMLVIAIGLANLPSRVYYGLLCVLVALNVASLYPRWSKAWSYSVLTDYRAAASFASAHVRGKTLVLNDGRSQEPLDVYLPAGIDRRSFWTYLQREDLGDLLSYDRIIFVSNDYQPARRQDADRLLSRLAQAFTITDGRVDYPLFEYVLDRKPAGDGGFNIDRSTGQVWQPLSMYGLEFQDLHLPVQLEAQGQKLTIMGAQGLSSDQSQREIVVPLADATIARRIVLVSSVTRAERLASGQQIAELAVTSADGTVRLFPLRYGVEVQDWSLTCAEQPACQTIYQWHKRVAFVGQQSYPGAWRDFQAGMHATSIRLPDQAKIEKLTVRYTAAAGNLYVWGIAVAH